MVNYSQMHEVIDFQVEISSNVRRLFMYKAIDKKFLLSSCLSKKILGRSFFLP